MLKILDNYDWEEAFKYATPRKSLPGEKISTDPFDREDVVELYDIDDGINDEADWICYGKLKDGRFFALSAGCDYTGWG